MKPEEYLKQAIIEPFSNFTYTMFNYSDEDHYIYVTIKQTGTENADVELPYTMEMDTNMNLSIEQADEIFSKIYQFNIDEIK